MPVGTIESLTRAILEYDAEAAGSWAKRVAVENLDPIKVMNELTATINQVGERFGKGELWLPDLVGAADAMQAAMPILEEEIDRKKIKIDAECVVVIGTVYGDIHNIGKDMVCTLLRSSGFAVYDLGVDVKTEQFVNAITMYHADILAMSSLLTTNISEMKKVIDALERDNLRENV